MISQAKINGRPIIVIEFDKALESRGWKIECLELPYPAEGKIYPNESWEHVEFVIPSHAETADEFLADLKHTYPAFGARFDELKELGVKIKLSSPKGGRRTLEQPNRGV